MESVTAKASNKMSPLPVKQFDHGTQPRGLTHGLGTMSTVENNAGAVGMGRRTASTSSTEDFRPRYVPLLASEPRHPPRQSPFESQLSGLLEEFASIESGDYKACFAFVKKHSEIWDCDEKVLLEDAFAALAANNAPHARRCIQRAVMIHACSNLAPSGVKSFFEGLINKKRSILEDFLQDCEDVTARIKTRASTALTSERPPAQDLDLNPVSAFSSISFQSDYPRNTGERKPLDQLPGLVTRTRDNISASLSLQSGYPRTTGEQRPADRFSGVALSTHQDAPTRQDTNIAQNRNIAAAVGRRRGSGASDVPTVFVDSEGHALDTLDSRYTIRSNSATFFTFGRVFATPWHTALNFNQANFMREWVVRDSFGQSILTHIQRMVVVKEGHGFSWCVPIFTYAGRGVAKPGLSKTDRLAHAIIYMRGTEPQKTASEADMMEKNPIAVNAAAADQKLDVMSRINFGKVHTIEHNVKVMNVGKISRDDMEDFKAYWYQYR